MDEARGLSSSFSSDFEEDSIPNTQDKGKHIAMEESFVTYLQEHAKQVISQINAKASKSVDILMAQDEEVSLPMPQACTTKRNKDPSKDLARASIALDKPSKSGKK